jgi:hypothetical protein
MKQFLMRSFGVVALAACIHPGTPKSVPTSFNTPRDRAEILRIATKSLTDDGFDITSTDTRLGIAIAKRVRSGTGNAKFVKCAFPGGPVTDAITEANIETTIEVTVRTRPNGAQVTTGVRVAVPGPAGAPVQLPTSQASCVSTGKAEANVTKAIEAANVIPSAARDHGLPR